MKYPTTLGENGPGGYGTQFLCITAPNFSLYGPVSARADEPAPEKAAAREAELEAKRKAREERLESERQAKAKARAEAKAERTRLREDRSRRLQEEAKKVTAEERQARRAASLVKARAAKAEKARLSQKPKAEPWPPEGYLTATAAAALVGRSPDWVWKHLKAGDIPCIRKDQRAAIRPEDIKAVSAAIAEKVKLQHQESMKKAQTIKFARAAAEDPQIKQARARRLDAERKRRRRAEIDEALSKIPRLARKSA